MRSKIRKSGSLIAIAAPVLVVMFGHIVEASSKKAAATPGIVKQIIKKHAGSLQLVTFPDTGWSPVKVVRGKVPTKSSGAPKTEVEKPETAEIVTFDDSRHSSVRVIRGESDRTAMIPGQPLRASGMRLEVVSFADPRERPISILRGAGSHLSDFDLFGPASVADLDRVAFAVDGAESSHGADLRMWRAEPLGPQGPMQITAAAATDVGGGDRFDVARNRALGRAYLARMFRRYGNWPDAIAAYNWGPGSIDGWIAEGRAADRLPLEVERYRDRVLRDATVAQTGAMMLTGAWPVRAPAAEPLSIGGVRDKEAALNGTVGHGRRYTIHGEPNPGGKLAIGAKQTAVNKPLAHRRQNALNHKMTSG